MITVNLRRSPEGDWIAMYINGKLIAEGNLLSEEMVIRELSNFIPLKLETSEMSDDELEIGHCNFEI